MRGLICPIFSGMAMIQEILSPLRLEPWLEPGSRMMEPGCNLPSGCLHVCSS